MIKLNLFIPITILPLIVSAQLINVTGTPFNNISDFNPNYIKDKNIKSVSMQYASKRDGDLIIDHKIERIYYFNREGEPNQEIYLEKRGESVDSLISLFEFDKHFKLTNQIDRYKKQENHHTIYYNSNGRVKQEILVEKTNKLSDTIMIKTYTDPYSDKHFAKRFILNTENRPFIEQRFYYDSKRRLINLEEDLFITSKRRNKKWHYDNDLLIGISYLDEINNKTKGKYRFEYQNNLQEFIYQYEKEELIKKTAFVYSVDEPTLLEALVIRYPKMEKIEIITLKYHYF